MIVEKCWYQEQNNSSLKSWVGPHRRIDPEEKHAVAAHSETLEYLEAFKLTQSEELLHKKVQKN